MKKIFTFFMLFLVTTFFTGCKDNNLVVDSENVIDLAQNYDYVYDFYDGFARVMKDNKCGVVNDKGNEIIPCKYDWIFIDDFYASNGSSFKNTSDLFITQEDGKYGFIDKTGKEVIECKYDDVYSFSEGMARVKKDGKYGLVDKDGKEVVECKYDYVDSFSEELVKVEKDGKYGFIDKTGKEVIECKYDDVYSFSEGMAKVGKGGKYNRYGNYGFIDKTGKEVTECKYANADSFSEGMAGVEKDGKWGFVDKDGKEVIECKYDDVYSFSEGMARVEKDGNYGFIDKTEKEVIECKYDFARDFSEGMAGVEKDGKWGFVDKDGKEVIECKYYFVWNFSKGVARVEKDGEYYIINTKGEICNPDEIINQDSIVNEEKTSNRIKSIVFRPTEYLVSEEGYCNCGDYEAEAFIGEYLGSSELVEGEKTYYADNLRHRESSSWVEGVEGYGIGEKLEINIIEGIVSKYDGWLCAYAESNGDVDKIKDYYYHLKGFWVVNGFAKNESLWEANSRVKKIKLTINDTKEYIVDLEDTRAIQYIDVDYKINNIVEPIKVVAEILEVYKGDKYEDTALSLFEPDYENNIPWNTYR